MDAWQVFLAMHFLSYCNAMEYKLKEELIIG